ncbi:SMI1/KNR4 family protein [Streptacidiphilus jiangxiensis]|uniref:Knr4/Smi1-like domain-containing protein n=1 Tax=Streptacidiphilus jiangxiensis TaxID=235985 RepID=A0A1H7VAA7_STRJI|nr:SMI1/KNR4 family protein [Streptacidiphilus jiangxiensis]SEM05697.1 hypothetical protein SAMN05414137_117170 [Streptacidiphilus jiangxiensis]
MTDTFDLAARLPAALRDRAEARSFLTDFVAHWAERPLQPGDGCTEAELTAAEERLGVPIPVALRDLYSLLGRRDDLTRNEHPLMAPGELRVVDGALVFRTENQGCCVWGVLVDDLDQENPAAVVRADLADKSQERWESWDAGLQASCLNLVMSEVLTSAGCTGFSDSSADAEHLTTWCTELPAFSYDTRWFVGPDVLVREVGGCFLYVRARSEAALEYFEGRVSGFSAC